MKQYITFHQVSFNSENLGIKKLFGLNTNMSIGVQQFSGSFLRNPKNSSQIEIPEKIDIVETEYNKFPNSKDAFEIVKSFVYSEFKLDSDSFSSNKSKNKELYFYIFENDPLENVPVFRGVFYATLISLKPLFYVAFTKSLEFEYDKEIYKK